MPVTSSPSKPKGLKGKISSLNISPKGKYESFLLSQGDDVVQVNLPKEGGHAFNRFLKIGADLDIKASAFKGKHDGDHPTYTLMHMNDGTKKIVPPVEGQKVKVKGVVKGLNYALHGKPNGALLDSGDFIHMKPEGAEAIGLELDQVLTVEGTLGHSIVDHRVIEAEKVNGVTMKAKPMPAKKASAKPVKKK